MPDTSVAAPQPAPEAQTSGEAKTQGPANVTMAQFAQRFMKPEASVSETPPPAQAEAAPVETAAEEAQAPAVDAAEPETTEAAPAEQDAEATAEDVPSKSTSLTPEQQAVVDKRIGKAVAKQRKAERDAAELKLRIAELEAKQASQPAKPQAETLPPAAPSTGPQFLGNIDTIAGLQKLQSEAKEAIRFAEDTLADIQDGAQAPEGWDKQRLRAVIRNARVTLEDHIPQRAQFLQNREQMRAKAIETLPFLADTNSAEFRETQALLNRLPFLRQAPESELIAGLLLKGIKSHEAEKAAAVTPEQPKKPVISKPKPSGDQTAVSAAGAQRVPAGSAVSRLLQEGKAKLAMKGGASATEYAQHLARQEQLRKSL